MRHAPVVPVSQSHTGCPSVSSCPVSPVLQAALGAIKCYLALHDAPAAAAAAEEAAEAQLAALSPEERKKEKLRRKKVREQAEGNLGHVN